MEKACAYIRVSTDDQSNSIEVQRKKIQEYCLFKNIELVQIFTDEGVSGGTSFYTRAGGAAANSLLLNSDIKIIICVKPDRMFRSVKDSLIVVDDWNQKNISLHIIDLGGNTIDTKTALGRMFFIQSISMSEFEKNIGGERTKAILQNKKATGKAYCANIYGFDNIEGKLVVNDYEMENVRDIFNMSDLLSAAKIADKFNELKIPAKKGGIFHASTIQNILKNPIYKQHI